MSNRPRPDNELPAMTIEDAGRLLGDDIEYWMSNPFMSPEMRTEKVLWWLTRMREVSLRAE
jgi:hypothetical protein